MALRLEFIQPYNGKTEMVVTPSVVAEIRWRWALKEYKSEDQQQFIENVMKIHYAPEEIYCLHRYELDSSFSMGKATGYLVKCRHCTFKYASDIYPHITE